MVDPIFITYGFIVATASICVYVGSWLSLNAVHAEQMKTKDVYMFPIIGGVTLTSLYLVFKFLDQYYVNLVLSSYFLIFGFAAIAWTLQPLFSKFLGSKKPLFVFTIPKIPLLVDEAIPMAIDFSHLIVYAISGSTCIYYAFTKYWIVCNFLSICFAIQGITMLSLGSFQNGVILLVGLFFYDIFFVFGTEIMVTVAKSFDAPIKIVFPRDVFAETFKFSMLGLGDIVIPGVFVALLLRFDRSLDIKLKATKYFNSNMLFYVVGLVVTIFVMHVFKAAQPALLYLVPAALIASFGTALINGQFWEMWYYEEKVKEEEGKETTKTK